MELKMDKIQAAFKKVKQDILFLNDEIALLKDSFDEINYKLNQILEKIDKIEQKPASIQQIPIQPSPVQTPTQPSAKPTQDTYNPTIPTDEWPYNELRSSIKPFSTGNDGVPTDRQTNQQTDRQQIFRRDNALQRAREIIDSLDNLKKEVRIKFKKLTEQELRIFSLLYQLDDEGELVDYPLLAQKTNLSESSARDYIHKIIKKGIPIIKEKLNNKRIILHISQDLKKIASLDTILRLRDI